MKNDSFPVRFAADLPYPAVCVTRANSAYGRAMLDNLGGDNSEMSAVAMYFYNNLITGGNDNLPLIFQKIGMVEMHHMEIFGHLARKLGENPRLWTHNNTKVDYWSPVYLHYSLDLQALLLNAIQGEKGAIAKYQEQAGYIKDIHIVENLKRIVLDEEIHLEILEGLYKKYFRV